MGFQPRQNNTYQTNTITPQEWNNQTQEQRQYASRNDYNPKKQGYNQDPTYTPPNQQNRQNGPLKLFSGILKGWIIDREGITNGKQWIKVKMTFTNDYNGYDRDFRSFTPFPFKDSIQVEELERGKRYTIKYDTKSYNDKNTGELRKSNTVKGVYLEQNQPQQTYNQGGMRDTTFRSATDTTPKMPPNIEEQQYNQYQGQAYTQHQGPYSKPQEVVKQFMQQAITVEEQGLWDTAPDFSNEEEWVLIAANSNCIFTDERAREVFRILSKQ